MWASLFSVWRESVGVLLVIGILHAWVKHEQNRYRLRQMGLGGLLGLVLAGVLVFSIGHADEWNARAQAEWTLVGMMLLLFLLLIMQRFFRIRLREQAPLDLTVIWMIGLFMLALVGGLIYIIIQHAGEWSAGMGEEWLLPGMLALMFLIFLMQISIWRYRRARNMKRNVEQAGVTKTEGRGEVGLLLVVVLGVGWKGSQAFQSLTDSMSQAAAWEAFTGAALLCLAGGITFFLPQIFSRMMAWKWFFRCSTIILLLQGGALLVAASDKMAGQLASWENVSEWTVRAIHEPLWDTSWLLEDGHGIWAALIGYRARPSLWQCLPLMVYWPGIGLFLRAYRQAIQVQKLQRLQKLQQRQPQPPFADDVVLHGGNHLSLWQMRFLLYGMMGGTIGVFGWSSGINFVSMKQELGRWLVAQGMVWPLEGTAPWWVLTHDLHSGIGEGFHWLSVVYIGVYIAGCSILLGGFLSVSLSLIRFVAHQGQALKHHLVHAYWPLVWAGPILGLLAILSIALDVRVTGLPLADHYLMMILLGAPLCSLYLAHQILSHYSLPRHAYLVSRFLFAVSMIPIVMVWIIIF